MKRASTVLTAGAGKGKGKRARTVDMDEEMDEADAPAEELAAQRDEAADDEHKHDERGANDVDDDDDDDDDAEEEEEEEDDDEDEMDEEQASQAARAFEDREQHDAGVVTKIGVENFMCHRNFSIELGPNVNFITGKNGSGKSAILAALQMCLGAKAGDTHRGKNVSGLIRRGHDGKAVLRVTLRNEGSKAYRPEVCGDKITIERHLQRGGTASYKLINATTGKQWSTRKEDLLDLLDQLNIQIDNPCCVLGQADAKSFVKQAGQGDGTELYNFFLRATDLERLRRKFEEQKSDRARMQAKVAGARRQLEVWQAKERDAAARWEECAAAATLEQKLGSAKATLVWARVEEEEQRARALEEKAGKLLQNVAKVEHKEEEVAAALARNAEESERETAALQGVTERAEAQAEKTRALQREIAPVQRRVDTARKLTRKLGGAIAAKEKRLAALERRLAEARAGQKAKAEEATRGRIERREALERAQRDAEAELARVEQAQSDEGAREAQLREELQGVASHRKSEENNLAHAKEQVMDLRAQQGDQLGRFGSSVPRLLQLVRQAVARGKFERAPVLIGTLVSVPAEHSHWATAAEVVVGGMMRNMLVTSHADKVVLLALRRQARCRPQEAMPIIMTHSARRYAVKYPQGAGPQAGARGLLPLERVLRVDEGENGEGAWVYNALVNQAKIESVLLFESREACQRGMVVGRLGSAQGVRTVQGATRGVMKDGRQLQVRSGNLTDTPFNRSRDAFQFGGDGGEPLERRLAQAEAEVQRREHALEVLAGDDRARRDEVTELMRRRRRQEAQLHSAQVAATRARQDARAARDKAAEEVEAALDAVGKKQHELEEGVDQLRRTIADERGELEATQAEETQATQQLAPLEARREGEQEAGSSARADVDQEQNELEERIEKLVAKRNELARNQARYAALRTKFEGKAKEAERLYKEALEHAAGAREGAVEFTKGWRREERQRGKAERQREKKSKKKKKTQKRKKPSRARRSRRRGDASDEDDDDEEEDDDDEEEEDEEEEEEEEEEEDEAADSEADGKAVDTHGMSPERMEQKIANLQRRIEQERTRRGAVDLDQLRRAKESAESQVARRLRKIKKVEKDIKRAKKGTRSRISTYSNFRKYIGKVTSAFFQSTIGKRSLAGSLSFDHTARTLTMQVAKDAGGGGASQLANVKMLSGGESSFTTASFLLSLWKSIECPFRVLDEFDVFMDDQNRSATLHLLQQTALQKSNNQFIFITPTSLASLKPHPKVRVHRMPEPPKGNRGQATLDESFEAAAE
eukprot:g5072.t1